MYLQIGVFLNIFRHSKILGNFLEGIYEINDIFLYDKNFDTDDYLWINSSTYEYFFSKSDPEI